MAPALRMTRSIKEKLQIFYGDSTVRTPKVAILFFGHLLDTALYEVFYGIALVFSPS